MVEQTGCTKPRVVLLFHAGRQRRGFADPGRYALLRGGTGDLFRVWESPVHRILHPDVLVEFLPAQGASLDAELDLLELGLRRIREQGVLRGREAHQTLVGELDPHPAAFHPAAHGSD
jgi:hypothetical protein